MKNRIIVVAVMAILMATTIFALPVRAEYVEFASGEDMPLRKMSYIRKAVQTINEALNAQTEQETVILVDCSGTMAKINAQVMSYLFGRDARVYAFADKCSEAFNLRTLNESRWGYVRIGYGAYSNAFQALLRGTLENPDAEIFVLTNLKQLEEPEWAMNCSFTGSITIVKYGDEDLERLFYQKVVELFPNATSVELVE